MGPSDMGLDPLAFSQDRMDQESLEAWTQFNRFAPVTDLNHGSWYDMKASGLTVVVLVHAGGSAGDAARLQFEKKAKELRVHSKYLFAVLNPSDEDSKDLLHKTFPLMSAAVLPVPRIFAASVDGGALRYWEDPSMTRAEDLTLESIEALLNNQEALQDGSAGAWVKSRRKVYVRFASQSSLSLVLAILVPLLVGGFVVMCCKAICASDEAEDTVGAKHDHVD